MSFRALLVTKDDQAVEALAPVLSNFGLTVHCCGYPDALCLVTEQKFQAVIVDFDDPHSATLILQNVSNFRPQKCAITIALLADKVRVRNAFGAGAKFVLYKPVNVEPAEGTLRAATAMIRNERRSALRVPLQLPVKLALNGSKEPVDGILLDLSEDGMDVLAAQPLYPSAVLSARFAPPDLPSELELTGEVAWANPNGESGIRFRDTPHSVREALRRWLRDHSKPVQPEKPLPMPGCKLTDLSLGGCYMETASPFPERTRVLLILRANGTELHVEGLVRVMHPSHGMGIEFAAYSSEHLRQTEAFIEFLISRPGVEPELLVSPRAESPDEHKIGLTSGDFEDPLLDLLRNHESLSQKMFLQTLEKQRTARLAESR